MSGVEFSDEELRALKRFARETDRKQSLGDMASDGFFEEWRERPHTLAALVTLVPKPGESWTEERLLLWLEVVEKTARLIYGLRSEWSDILGAESPPQRVRANAASDRAEPPEEDVEEAERLAGLAESEIERTKPLRERIPAVLADRALSKDELCLALEQAQGVGAALARLIKGGEVWEQDGNYGLPQHDQPEPGALKEAIVALLNERGIALRKKEIGEQFPDLIPGQVWDALDDLLAAKKIEKCGATSGTSYRISAKPVPAKTNAEIDRRAAEVAERARREGHARPASEVTVRRVDPSLLAGGA